MSRSSWLALPLLLLLACSARMAADCEQLAGATFCDSLPEASATFPLGWNTTTSSGREKAFACQLRIHQKELGLTDLQTAYVIASVWRESRFNLVSQAGCRNNRCRCPPECTPSTTCQACLDSTSACAKCTPPESRNCTCLADRCPSPLAAWYSPYYGRGYLKLLWKDNYASMAGLFNNCPLDAKPEILLRNHAVALKVAVQIMINAGLKNYLPASITNPTDEQLVKARRMVNAADVKDCSASGLPADCPVSNCDSQVDADQQRTCKTIASISNKARTWLAQLQSPIYRIAYCGKSVPAGGDVARFAPLVRLSQYPRIRVTHNWYRRWDDKDKLVTTTAWLGGLTGAVCSWLNKPNQYVRYKEQATDLGGKVVVTIDVAAALRDGKLSATANTEITQHHAWSPGFGDVTVAFELLDSGGVVRSLPGGRLIQFPSFIDTCEERRQVATIKLALHECGNVPDSAYYSVSIVPAANSRPALATASEATAAAALPQGDAPFEEPPPLEPGGTTDPPPEGVAVEGAP